MHQCIVLFRTDCPEHLTCRAWLEDVFTGDARYGMAPQVLSGVIRITTHPKAFAMPSSLDEALQYCDILLDQPHFVIIEPSEPHWRIFKRLCTAADARGNLIPDALFAALAIESGCEWITLDHDYARFPGHQWRVPV